MIEITHVARHASLRDRIMEVGAMDSSGVRWRLASGEAMARAGRGTQYFVRQNGVPVLVECVRGGVFRPAYLRTVPDFTGTNGLLMLPDLPVAATSP